MCACWRRYATGGQLWVVQILVPFCVSLAHFFLLTDHDISSQLFLPPWTLALRSHNPPPQKKLSVIMLYHGNRKVIQTDPCYHSRVWTMTDPFIVVPSPKLARYGNQQRTQRAVIVCALLMIIKWETRVGSWSQQGLAVASLTLSSPSSAPAGVSWNGASSKDQ